MTIRRSGHRIFPDPILRCTALGLAVGLGISPAAVAQIGAAVSAESAAAASRPFTPPRPEHKPAGGPDAGAEAVAGPIPESKPTPPPAAGAGPTQIAEAPIAPPAPQTRPAMPPEGPAEAATREPPAAEPAPAAETQVAALPESPRSIGMAQGGGFTIAFEPGSDDLSEAGARLLAGLVQRMMEDEELRLDVRAYAGGTSETASQARRLSLNRALAVRSFLVDRGVRGTRIDVRALGATAPEGSQERVDLKFSD